MYRSYHVLCVLCIIACVHRAPQSQAYTWGNARNIGPTINSPAKDEHPTFAGNGTIMYFASTREGGFGGYDLYVSWYKDGEWSEAQALSSPINTPQDEFDPFITRDGTKLFFASNRDNEGPYWDCDIYVCELHDDTWTEPHIFDSIFVTPHKPDWGVTMNGNGTLLIFSSGRDPAPEQSVQIFQSEWLGNSWSAPQALPMPVNSGIWEATPYLTDDGKTLYINSARGEEGKKDVDIWKFECVDGIWQNPELLGGTFVSNKNDYDPCLTPDGEQFYFTSNREGGYGDADIYVVEKVLAK